MNSIVLFKNNLRINDNPPLFYASQYQNKLLPIYIYDNINIKKELGGASKYWLFNALKSLNKSLNNNLLFLKGDTSYILKDIVKKHSISNIFCEKPFLKMKLYYLKTKNRIIKL